MIKFIKKIEELLPYDRKQYISRKKWYGVSFQLPGVFEGKDIGLGVYLQNYEEWFRSIISGLDNGLPWIINHDFIDEDWFPNNENNLTTLRTLFKNKSIPNTFKGGIILTKDEMLEVARDLISYPYAVFDKKELLYNNLDISHGEVQFVIKISAHLNIDFLSTDKDLLRKVVNTYSNNFILKEYRGTSLIM
ncbi:hypothetical protein EZJ43_14690 [Pedobacter changchengzhani]|uniref:Uncharacterized protein n=1 Tax=Pedobacter changchengzhani TaxID=2529274 RepID=A0A4R5MHY0_9SPHI|nr:hypothetical protein [Pedobacter changchengzhani]TDG35148.1 hypothetical protein EZJ43_14690 [Pedobacter changchengzhani]